MRAHLLAEIGWLAGKVVGNPSGHPGIVAYRDLVVGHRVGGWVGGHMLHPPRDVLREVPTAVQPLQLLCNNTTAKMHSLEKAAENIIVVDVNM